MLINLAVVKWLRKIRARLTLLVEFFSFFCESLSFRFVATALASIMRGLIAMIG